LGLINTVGGIVLTNKPKTLLSDCAERSKEDCYAFKLSAE